MRKRVLSMLPVILLSFSFLTGCKDSYDAEGHDNVLQVQINTLKKDITKLNSEIDSLKAELASNKKVIQDDYESQIASLARTINYLSNQLEQLSSDYQRDKASITEDYNNKINALAAQYGPQISSIESQIAAFNSQIEELQNKDVDTEEELESINHDIETLQADVETLETSLKTFSNTYNSDKASIQQDYNTKINALSAAYQNKVDLIDAAIEAANTSIRELSAQMNEALIILESDYNSKINSLTERVAALEQTTYHTVSFVTNNGQSLASQSVKHGEKVRDPGSLNNRTGYTFAGWKYQGEMWSIVGYTVTENMTLTAEWTPNKYDITYSLPLGATHNNPDSYTYGVGLSLNDAYLPGYTFLGWYKGSANVTGINYNQTGNVSLEARFASTGDNYQITLNADGGRLTTSSYNVTYGGSYSFNKPYKAHYVFAGWYLGNTLVLNDGTDIWNYSLGNVTLTAHYTPVAYKVTYFTTSDAELSPLNPKTVTIEDDITLVNPICSDAGYDTYWTYKDTTTKVTRLTGIDHDISLASNKVAIRFDISFNTDLNYYQSVPSQTIYYGQSYSLPVPASMFGGDFSAWYIDVNGHRLYVEQSGTWHYTPADFGGARSFTLIAL